MLCLFWSFILHPHQPTWKQNVLAHILRAAYEAQCVRGLVVAGGRLLCHYPAACEEGRGQQAACLCLYVCLQANQPQSSREERGCDLAAPQLLRNSWFTFQFNVALPRSPHACLPARLTGDYGATGQKQLPHKDTPSNYFQWQRTIWWPSQRVELHTTVTPLL